jgi:RNase P/RNase MRP subunit POP5
MMVTTEVFLALIMVVLLEAVYIAVLSTRTKILAKRVKETEEKLKVIEEISHWEKMEKMAKEETKRKRKRYIVFRLVSEEMLPQEIIWQKIRSIISKVYGEPFLNKAMVDLVHYDEEKKAGILRVEQRYREQVIGALGLLREKNLVVIPVKTAGTIRKAREYIY